MSARTGKPAGRPRGARDSAPRSRAGWTAERRREASEAGRRGNAARWGAPDELRVERDGYDQRGEAR